MTDRIPDQRESRSAPEAINGEAGPQVRHASVSTDTIDMAALTEAVQDPRCGAVVTFCGVVRNHDDGAAVTELHYESHPTANAVIADVAEEITKKFPQVLIAVQHRVGTLQVGEVALGAVTASAHRGEAFQASVQLVDTVKERLPIWKHQMFTDGTTEWVNSLG